MTKPILIGLGIMAISLILLAVAMCRAKTPDFGARKPKVPDLPPVEYHYRNFGGAAYNRPYIKE